MSTTAIIPETDPTLTATITDNPSADAYAKRATKPHFYRQDLGGQWSLAPWLAALLNESEEGRLQRIYADTLLDLGLPSRADAAASCDHSWFPYKECATKTPEGKKHAVVITKTHCGMPSCARCGDERERLDYFLYRDKGDFMSAAPEIIASCEKSGRNPVVARIRLTIDHSGPRTYMSVRHGQENIHELFDRWRDRLLAQHKVPSHQQGMILSDFPSPNKAELWVLYIGPNIPGTDLRDNWKEVAGDKARFWHMRRSVTGHDTECTQDKFEGMLEAELQHIFTMPYWIRKGTPDVRARFQAAFSRFQMIRQVGHFYGYRQPTEHVGEAEADLFAAESQPISDEELYALFTVPVTEVVCCFHCRAPLTIPQIRQSGHIHEFHATYDHVTLHYNRQRHLHKHNSVSMCGEEWRRYEQRRANLRVNSASPPS